MRAALALKMQIPGPGARRPDFAMYPMRKSKLYEVTLLALLLSGVANDALPQQSNEVKVWAVGSDQTKVYHCPGSRWYRVGDGREIGECQARHEGYQPAFGTGCGSSCLQASRHGTGSAGDCIDGSIAQGGAIL